MALKRYFFTSDDLDDLERFEEELEEAGLVTPQIHVLTLDDSGADNHHHLHAVTSLMKKDIIHSGLIGAGIGACAAALALIVAYLAGWTDTPAGWIPFIFLAVILFGFFTWEGGLWGIQTPNVHFKQFQSLLEDGKHVFFVDVEPEQGRIVNKLLKDHPTMRKAGKARGAPKWIVMGQNRFRKIVVESLP
jgi:hypothetical protein